MKIQKDSISFARASEKSYRLLPQMFRPKLLTRFGQFIITRSVVGSKGFVYTVKIWNEQLTTFNAVCDCPAGKKEMPCYHVAAVWLDYQSLKINRKIYHLDLLPTVVSSSYVN